MSAKPKLQVVKQPKPSEWDLYLYQNYLLAEDLNDDVTKSNILDKILELRKNDYRLTMSIP